MKFKNIIQLVIIGTVFLLLAGFTNNYLFSSENPANEFIPPNAPIEALENLPSLEGMKREPLADETPITILDENDNVVWKGNSKEYNSLLDNDSDYFNKLMKAKNNN